MQKTLTGTAICVALLMGAAVAQPVGLSKQAQYDSLNYYSKRLDAAKQHCGSDKVLWQDTKTGAISQPGSSGYGTSESGRYVCEHDQSQGRYGTEAEPTTVTPTTPQPATPQAPPDSTPKQSTPY